MSSLEDQFTADMEKSADASMVRHRAIMERRHEAKKKREAEAECSTKEAAKVPHLVGKEVGKAKHRSAALGAALSSALGLPVAYSVGRYHGAADAGQKHKTKAR
jgi:hypothetical protein